MVEQLSTLTQCIWIMFTDVDFSVDHQHVLEVFLSPCRIHPVFNAVLPEVSNITFLSLPHRDFTRLCVVDVIFKVFAILHSGTLFRCFFLQIGQFVTASVKCSVILLTCCQLTYLVTKCSSCCFFFSSIYISNPITTFWDVLLPNSKYNFSWNSKTTMFSFLFGE